MSTAILQLIVWAPFLLVALICGIIFGILGYKRGSARAGISVGVTVISSVVAIAVSKLVSMLAAGLVSPYLVNFLSERAPEGLEAAQMVSMATGLANGVCSVVLYIPVFLIVACILKPVVSSITKKLPAPKSVGNRLGGLSISLVDALIYSFLLLIPVYGTLALADNVLETAYVLSEDAKGGWDGQGTIGMVREIVSTPIVDLADLPPFSTAYDSLLTFKVEGSRVNLGSTVRSSCGLLRDVVRFSRGGDMSDKEALISILTKTERFLVKNEFITDFACTYGYGMLPKLNVPGVGKVEISEYYPAISDSEMLREDIPALVGLMRAMVESGMLDALQSKDFDMSKVDSEMMSEAFGETFNHSPSIAALKSRVVKALVSELTKELGEDDPAIKELTDAISSIPEAPLKGDAAKKEGEALYMIMSGMLTASDKDHSGKAVGLMIEGLARHPSVGVDKVANAADSLLSESGMSGASTLTQSIKDKLNDSVNKPVNESTFPDFCDTAVNTAAALGDIASGENGEESLKNLISSSPEALESVRDVLSDELLKEMGVGEESEKITDVVDAIFDSIIEAELTDEQAEREAAALNELLAIVTSDKTGDTVRERADELIGVCADSVLINKTLDSLTASGKSDPMGLFGSLTSEAKVEIGDKIDGYVAENGANETLEDLKLFIGVK